jgi:branched-chain amino acid transport system permease protein
MDGRRAIPIAALVAALLTLPYWAGNFGIYLAMQMMLLSLFALGFNLLLGYTGLLSFGQAGFFATGAYVCALILLEAPTLLLGIVGGVAAAGLVALVLGYLCVRLTEIYFAMLTLAFSQLVFAVAFKWNAVTGGDNGFVGARLPDVLRAEGPFLYFALGVVAACLAVLFVINRSAFGRVLHATRENPMRAAFVGINVRLVRLVAFVISGTFSGVAGALYGLFKRSMFPEAAYWTRSADVLIMTILGGIYSFFGPFLGGIVMVALNRITAQYTVYWPTVLGLTLLFVLFFMPSGLVGLFASDPRHHARAFRPLEALRRLSGRGQRQPEG